MIKTRSDWEAAALGLTIEARAAIDGQYVGAADGETFACHSPIDGRKLADVAACSEADVAIAVAAARRSFDSGAWSGLSAKRRKAILLRWADLMQVHAEELALLECLDAGKPISATLQSDVPSVIETTKWFAEAIDKLNDEVAPVDPHLLGLVTREPIGVVAAITPWNYPLVTAGWKFAPALAAGNSVILKPSEKTPLTAIRIAGLAQEAGLPDGVFNVLPGDGRTGEALARHMDVDCVAFTGSTGVGRKVMIAAAQSNLKRVWLELGGKSACIVMSDCTSLAEPAAAVAAGVFLNAGQTCSEPTRVQVERPVLEQFRQLLVAAAADYRPGHPLDPETSVGAVIDPIQMAKVCDYIAIGSAEGRLLTGGERLAPVAGGTYVAPTIVETTPTARVAREEIFGPVLSLIPFEGADEAVAIANDSDYGLAASVWSDDTRTAHRLARQLRAGTVWVNCYDEWDMSLPFGGFKQSGNGRDNSLHALEKYTELKAGVFRIG